MSRYSYSSENRLRHPCSYMYTPIESGSFFSEYRASRQLVIKRLAATGGEAYPTAVTAGSMFAALPVPAILNLSTGAGLSRYTLSDPAAEKIATGDLIRELLSALTGDVCAQSDLAWLDRLSRRFEVSKKLFTQYGPKLRNGDGKSDDLRIYALAALALSLGAQLQRSCRYLNTLLKIDDLLCSVPELVESDPVTAVTTCFALNNELRLVETLKKKNGIANEAG